MRNLSKTIYLLSMLFPLIFSIAAYSQKSTDEETINIDTLLLNVPVIVSDRDGRHLGGLKKENFFVLENEEKHPVAFFADDSAPMHVAIVIDTSASTKKILGGIKDAARDFIKALAADDKVMIASFDSKTIIWSKFTSDQQALTEAIDKIKSEGASMMYDTVYELMRKHFAPLQGRKAMIVLTDGYVEPHMVSENKLIRALTESDIMVYPLLFEYRSTEVEKEAIELSRNYRILEMSKFSQITGGRVFHSGRTSLKIAFQEIADELKKQYVIGFYPSDDKREKIYKIGLRLDRRLYDPENVVLRTKNIISSKSRGSQKKLKN